MRTLPDSIKIQQENKKKQTIDSVQRAINELKSEGYIVTTKLLMDRTGYARSTFSKSHVKELLRLNKVCMFRDTKFIHDQKYDEKGFLELKNELEKANKNIVALKGIIDGKNQRIDKLLGELEERKADYQLLLGHLHIAIQKAEIQGVHLQIPQ